jgi:hypothetical protein
MGSGLDGTVLALGVYDSGSGPELYAGGLFLLSGSVLVPGLAKWNGTQWSLVGGGLTGNPVQVFGLAVFDDGLGASLYVAGHFSAAGGIPANTLVRWNGTTWSSIGETDAGFTSAIPFDDGSGTSLFMGGDFHEADGFASPYIAAWKNCHEIGTAFCAGDTLTICPCGESGLLGHGCSNSSARGAIVRGSGTTNPDTVVIVGEAEPTDAASVLVQGSAATQPMAFGDGVSCLGGNLLVLYVHNASDGSIQLPAPGDPTISARSLALGDLIAPGSMRYYQVFYRDPVLTHCPPPSGNSWNASNAVAITW